MVSRRLTEPPRRLFADDKGRIYDYPLLLMIGRSGQRETLPDRGPCIPLPAMRAITSTFQAAPLGGWILKPARSSH